MKLACDVIRDLLPSYIDGLTSAASNTLIGEHIAECPNCRQELETFKRELPLPTAPVPSAADEAGRKAISRLRRSMLISKMMLIALGAIFGTYAISQNPFQAPFLVYPLAGIIGELFFRDLSTAAGVVFVANMVGVYFFGDFHWSYLFMSAIYTAFTIFGGLFAYSVRQVFCRAS